MKERILKMIDNSPFQELCSTSFCNVDGMSGDFEMSIKDVTIILQVNQDVTTALNELRDEHIIEIVPTPIETLLAIGAPIPNKKLWNGGKITKDRWHPVIIRRKNKINKV